MDWSIKLLAYFFPLFAIWYAHTRRRLHLERRHAVVKEQASKEGLNEPASLHPVIDAARCIGCRSCLNACPEQGEHAVLGLINGKAELIGASDCIGHGACRTACPVDAITLVFGTEKRGVDIPDVKPNFETNVPGVFISGELGGMGLIRNAIEQGRQAVESIARQQVSYGDPEMLDVVIVGAGPAGFSASLAALQHRLEFVTLEQYSLGGAISQYPRGKLAMLHAAELPFLGKFKLGQSSKEQLLALFRDVERKAALTIRYEERMEDVVAEARGFLVTTSRGEYRTRNVLLALGRRGTPRKLGVPGEHLPKVVYRLLDPVQYRGRKVLVVGGGDSALEAATSIAEQDGAEVRLVHRSEALNRAKAGNRRRLRHFEERGLLHVMLKSQLREIGSEHALIEQEGRSVRVLNDAVIVCVGGVLPTQLLERLGVRFETKHGTA